MYGMYFLFVVFTKVEGLLLPFLYIHTCVIFNKCIQTLNIYICLFYKKINSENEPVINSAAR